MKYLLDTMVVSEAAKPKPNAKVIAWLEQQNAYDQAVSVITLGEIRRGIVGMQDGRRKTELAAWLVSDLPAHFGDRLLGLDTQVALAWGTLSAEGDRMGRPLPVIDGLLLATAQAHALTLVTRNVGDCDGRGVPVFNPYL